MTRYVSKMAKRDQYLATNVSSHINCCGKNFAKLQNDYQKLSFAANESLLSFIWYTMKNILINFLNLANIKPDGFKLEAVLMIFRIARDY